MEGLRVWYDREGDMLEVVFDEAPAVMEEVSDDLFERRTTDGRVIGFMVMNFSKHDRELIQVPLNVRVQPI